MAHKQKQPTELLGELLGGIHNLIHQFTDTIEAIDANKIPDLKTKLSREAAASTFAYCSDRLVELVKNTMGVSVEESLEEVFDDGTLFFKAVKDGKPVVTSGLVQNKTDDKKFDELPEITQKMVVWDMRKVIAKNLGVDIETVKRITKEEAEKIKTSILLAKQMEEAFNSLVKKNG